MCRNCAGLPRRERIRIHGVGRSDDELKQNHRFQCELNVSRAMHTTPTCGTCGKDMMFSQRLRLWVCSGCGQMGGNCICVDVGGQTDE